MEHIGKIIKGGIIMTTLIILVLVIYILKQKGVNFMKIKGLHLDFLDKSTKLYKLVDKRANEVLGIYKDKSKYKIVSYYNLVSEKPEGVRVTLTIFYEGEEDEAIKRYAYRILDDICPEKHDIEYIDNYVKSDDGMTMVIASALIK